LQVEEEDEEFVEEFLSRADPSILHFLIASGAHSSLLHFVSIRLSFLTGSCSGLPLPDRSDCF
jgi:hypothetical protein